MVVPQQFGQKPVLDENQISTSRFRSLTGPFRLIFIGLTAAGILLAVHQILALQIITGVVLLENSYLYLMLAFFLSNLLRNGNICVN